MEVEKVSLLCPISGLKIVNPVREDASSENVFDKQSIEEQLCGIYPNNYLLLFK